MNFVKEELTFNKDGDAIFTAQIKDFYHKMKNWAPGGSIRSREFRVQEQDLQLLIYPNGLFDGNASVFLINATSKSVFVNFKLQIGDQQEKEVKSCCIQPKSSWGFLTLCNHVTVYPDYKADEELKVVCKIKKLTTDKVVWDMYNETKVKGEESGSKHEETQNKLRVMETKLEELTNFKMMKPPCPVCLEEMSGNTRIAQCNNGHLLCWSCKEKMDNNNCPSCRLPVDGRAFGMENYLRSLFGFD